MLLPWGYVTAKSLLGCLIKNDRMLRTKVKLLLQTPPILDIRNSTLPGFPPKPSCNKNSVFLSFLQEFAIFLSPLMCNVINVITALKKIYMRSSRVCMSLRWRRTKQSDFRFFFQYYYLWWCSRIRWKSLRPLLVHVLVRLDPGKYFRFR